MAKQLPHGWFKASLHEVLRSSRLSVLLTVCVLPSVLSQVLVLLNASVPPWFLLVALCLLLLGALGTSFLGAVAARRRSQHGLITNRLRAKQLGRITGVVTMVSNLGGPREKAFQSLVRNLPSLRTVYAVTCPGEEAQVDVLRAWLDVTAPQVGVRHLHASVDRHRPSDETVDKLGRELGLLAGDGLVVDITTDNSLCTVTMLEAAKEVGRIPATFLASLSPTNPFSDEFALVAVYDPTGTFDDEPEPAPIDPA